MWYDRPLGPALLALPLLLLIEGTLIVGLGLVAATLNVFYRDVQHVVSVGLMLLFYLTPVFYDVDPTMAGAQLLYFVNPMAALVDGYRAIFFSGVLPAGSRTAVAGVSVSPLRPLAYGSTAGSSTTSLTSSRNHDAMTNARLESTD